MKRVNAGILAVCLILCFTGCDRKVKDVHIRFEFAEDVSQIEVMHVYMGRAPEWTIEGDDAWAVRKWLSNLECRMVEFEKGNTPGDTEGGEVYSFKCVQYSSASYPGFSYMKNGEDDCYLIIQGNWYSVLNPSDPPVEDPAE